MLVSFWSSDTCIMLFFWFVYAYSDLFFCFPAVDLKCERGIKFSVVDHIESLDKI